MNERIVIAEERSDEAIHAAIHRGGLPRERSSSGAHSRDPLARNDEVDDSN